MQTRKNHRFEESVPYNATKGCPAGYHKRDSYKTSTGKTVPTRCVRATTTYKQSSQNFKRAVTRKATQRLKRAGITATTVKNKGSCPPGHLLRKAYVRRYSTNIRDRGYTVRRGRQMFKAYPKSTSTIVKAACIKDRGLVGKGPQAIGPLRRGELMKHGYSYRKSDFDRHEALRKAAKEYGVLGVYRKLNAVAKLTKRTEPKISTVFRGDRDWVRRRLGPVKAF